MREHPLKVLVVGSGGREHALCWKLAQSNRVEKIFCAPGNGGTQAEAKCENVDISVMDFAKLKTFALNEKIDLTVIGPDNPLAEGIVDELESAGLRVFGPTKEQAKMESSKAHAKEFMDRVKVPTPRYIVCRSHEQAKEAARLNAWAQVVKVDGLALGKGVFVCDKAEEVLQAIDQIFSSKTFGQAGETVLLEEKIDGEELSLLMLCDGKHLLPLAACQDHKRRFDGDSGPNTGGMGAYSPVELYERCKKEIDSSIVKPLEKALQSGQLSFKGVLYAGIIVPTKDPSRPLVLEFNARFGDPETQALMPRLKSDLLDALWACTSGELNTIKLQWIQESSCCVVAVAEDYPAKSSRGEEISLPPTNPAKAHSTSEALGAPALAGNSDGAVIFHAGTKIVDGKLVTDGGRILSVVATASSMEEAADQAYASLKHVSFKSLAYRRDIARRAFKKCLSN